MKNPVLLFDGVCNLCNFFVKFILRHERNEIIYFASLQSNEAKKLISEIGLFAGEIVPSTVIFISNGKIYTEASAVFEIAKHLKKPFSYLSAFKVFPKPFTNFFYKIISRNRYSIFGKRETCMVPDKKWESRFIDF